MANEYDVNEIFEDLLGGDIELEEPASTKAGLPDRYIMLCEVIKGDLIYIADGMERDLHYLISMLDKLSQFRIIKIAVTSDVDVESMRRNSTALNEKYRHLIDK